MNWIDLRSDTVTQPSPEMREAMYRAPLGDDVFGDDPTVNELESLAAAFLGKEAALFVTSGTQGNAVSLLAHTRQGDSVVMGRTCHIADHENGSYGMLAGVSPRFAEDADGVLIPDSVEAQIQDDSDLHLPPTGLVCVENALSNGNVAPLENMRKIYEIAKRKGLPVHLDGARLPNAALALGAEVKDLTANCDSVMCCLSKGLAAPVGSVVAGDAAFVARAKRMRKMLGGGLRQAGILAAAGILALTEMPGRLGQDHENAVYLAKLLGALPGVRVDVERIKINMVFLEVDWPQPVIAALPAAMLEEGIRVIAGNPMRLVTHYNVSRTDCETVAAAFARYLDSALHG